MRTKATWLRFRRPFIPRYRLRTLLLVVIVFAIALGWIGHLWRHVNRERRVVARIQALGGDVFLARSNRAPKFVGAMFGTELIYEPFKIELEGAQCAPSAIPELTTLFAELPDLEVLNISGIAMTDDDLESVSRLRLPGGLSLTACPLTSTGVEHLKQLRHARELILDSTGISRLEAERLQSSLPHCTVLYDPDGDITDDQWTEHIRRRGPITGLASQ